MTLKFIPNGKVGTERAYSLEWNGEKVGYAYAKVSQNVTGLTKVRGTSYSAHINVLNKNFSGSRNTITREITRAITA